MLVIYIVVLKCCAVTQTSNSVKDWIVVTMKMLDRQTEKQTDTNVTSVNANTDSYSQQWGEHLLRRNGSRIPEITFTHNP